MRNTRRVDVGVETEGGKTIHQIIFSDGPISLSHHGHVEVRRALILREFGAREELCPCIRLYADILGLVGVTHTPAERAKEHYPTRGHLYADHRSDSLYGAYLQRFQGQADVDDYRLARRWRKAWNKRTNGRRLEGWYHASMGPQMAWRFLDFPMAVLKELRQRGLPAVHDNWNRIGMQGGKRRPYATLQFFSQGTTRRSQFWRLLGPDHVDRYLQFHEDREEGDQDIRRGADAVEESWLIGTERWRAMLGSGRTQASRRLAVLEDMFGVTTPGSENVVPPTGDPRPAAPVER